MKVGTGNIAHLVAFVLIVLADKSHDNVNQPSTTQQQLQHITAGLHLAWQFLCHCPRARTLVCTVHAPPFVCTARAAHGAPGEPRQKPRPQQMEDTRAATASGARQAATRGSELPLQRVAAGGQAARSDCFHLTHTGFSELDRSKGGKRGGKEILLSF